MARPMRKDLMDLFADAEENGRFLAANGKALARRLAHAERNGQVIRCIGNCFARKGHWERLSPEARHLNTLRAMRERKRNVIFTHTSAALVHGLAVSYSRLDEIHVATAKKAHSRSHGPIKRHVIIRDTSDVVGGLRVTSFERTVYDCLLELPFDEALAVADSALRKKDVTRGHLEEEFERFAWHVVDGRRPLEILALANPLSENGGESMSRAQMLLCGFVEPKLQVEHEDPMNPRKKYRVDFQWNISETEAVVGELDGHDKYVDPSMTGGRTTEDVLLSERQRESRILGSKGIRVMRFTYRQMRDASFFEKLLDTYGVPRATDVAPVVIRPSRRHRPRRKMQLRPRKRTDARKTEFIAT